MTTRIAKAATITVGAAVVVLALLAYSAVFAPAAAQTATSTSSTSSSTSSASTTSSAVRTACMCWNSTPGPHGGIGGRPGGLPPGWQGQGGPGPGRFGFQQQSKVNVSVGQTISLTSTQGMYHVVGNSSESGTASGALTFTVTGSLSQGYTLSLTSGNIVVGGTTYTISSGSAVMNPSASVISGQGTTSSAGAFIVQATAHGSFVGSSGSVSLDFKAGSAEYLVNLTTSVQG